eukprot:gene12768-12896_t
MVAMPEYLWLVVMGAFAAAGFGWATGANDVANAFGTSVGAKTITLRQAVLIAAIFEFGGAMLLGRVVTNTIAGGIADPTVFARQPEIYAYGMVVALAIGFLWQGWASYAGMNVSATHSIIGGIIGFALVFAGSPAVQWATPDPTQFPPYKGVVPIILSWFFSPVLTGVASAMIFTVLKYTVLRRQNAASMAFWVLPPAVFITVFINCFFVLTKGAAKTLGKSWSTSKAAWVSALVGAGTAIICAVVVLPILRIRSRKYHERVEAQEAAAATKCPTSKSVDGAIEGQTIDMQAGVDAAPARGLKKWMSKAKDAALYGTSVDIHQAVEEDEFIAALHARAEQFDSHAEHTFGYLQVFSAICVVFAHGAGEVGFMAGPLSAIYDVYQNGHLSKSLQPQIWCVVLGAVSLVVGLATYGYNVTRTMGVSMAKLSPSRGFAAELSTALVILVASQLGLPTSSSQCITGGIIGVGLCEGIAKGVNWKMFGKQFASWVSTLFVVGLGVAAVFAQGIYSPSEVDGGLVLKYENALANSTSSMLTQFNTSLLAFKPAAEAGALRTLSPAKIEELNNTIEGIAKANSAITTVKDNTAVNPADALAAHSAAIKLFQDNSVFTLGQNNVYPGAMVCNGADPAAIKSNTQEACQSPAVVQLQ